MFCYTRSIPWHQSCNPPPKAGFRLFPVRSSLTKGISCDFFSSGYLDISVPRLTPPIQVSGPMRFHAKRLPYSDTAGSKLRSSSPTTFAALCVLLRPNKPEASTICIRLQIYILMKLQMSCPTIKLVMIKMRPLAHDNNHVTFFTC